jgi:ATP-dependent DNA ligase
MAKPVPPLRPEKPKKDKKPAPAFDSVLKNIAKLKVSSRTTEEADKHAEGNTSTHVGKVGATLTMSEIDALKQQIAGCWSINPGAKDIEQFSITVQIWVNPDRTVRDVKVIQNAVHAGNPFYRSFVESALRAVRDPRCSPLRLPPDKYDLWKELHLNFRPADLIR